MIKLLTPLWITGFALWITQAVLAVDYGPSGPVDYASLWISQHFVLGRIYPRAGLAVD